ncbi:MAG: TRAP transporter large permease [Clostridiales Family XIII bacterium]|nr:TRAP transporter large permease [Clostridiales Family XIII bacterium]
MNPIAVGIIGMVILIALLFMGLHVGITMMLIGFFGYAYIVHTQGAIGMLKGVLYSTGSNYSLSVIPMFVLMGHFAYYSGLSKELYNVAYKWLGRLPGGLAVATIGACGFFAAICGSSTATAATFGTVTLPEMKRYKYHNSLATGSIAAGGTLGILIPPSVGFILYGIISGQSIGRLFAAGFLPGFLLAFCFITVIIFQVKRNPALAPEIEKSSFREKMIALGGVVPVLVIFIFVIGGMFGGLFTANEASAVGAIGAFIYLIIKKQASFENIKKALEATVKTTAMIFLILIGAYAFGYFLAITTIPTALASFISGLDVNRYVILIAILIFYALLGCIMDSLAMVLLTVPIFFPVISGLGFDPIWYGVLMVMVMEMGLITPPVGMNLYIIKGVAGDEIGIKEIIQGAFPHVIAMMVAVIIVVIFPIIALALPNLFYGSV